MPDLPSYLRATCVAVLVSSVAMGCTPLAGQTRAAQSSLGCMRAALQGRDFAGLDDRALHCLAAGFIARYCSLSEAAMASVGKELRDTVGPGDAQWRDLESDRRGIDCARGTESDAELEACCRQVAGHETIKN